MMTIIEDGFQCRNCGQVLKENEAHFALRLGECRVVYSDDQFWAKYEVN